MHPNTSDKYCEKNVATKDTGTKIWDINTNLARQNADKYEEYILYQFTATGVFKEFFVYISFVCICPLWKSASKVTLRNIFWLNMWLYQ